MESPPKKKYKLYTSDKSIPRSTLWRRQCNDSYQKSECKDTSLDYSLDDSLCSDNSNNESLGPLNERESALEGEEINSEDPVSECKDTSLDYSLDDSLCSDKSNNESLGPLNERESALEGEEINSEDPVSECKDTSLDYSLDDSLCSDISNNESLGPLNERESAQECDSRGVSLDAKLLEMLVRKVKMSNEITVGEVLTMVTSVADRHNLSDRCVVDLMMMLSTILGGNNSLPSSSYKINKTFRSYLNYITYYVYCVKCGACVGNMKRESVTQEVICPTENCRELCKLSLSEGNFFVIIDVMSQFQAILEGNDEFIRNQNNATSGVMKGPEEGGLYKSLLQATDFSETDFTYNINVDGAQMFNTSCHSLYPIQLIINELPSQVRFRNVVLAGLWYGKGPIMETFMQPFVKETLKVSKGVLWHKRNGSLVKSKFFPLCVCVDSVARPTLQNHVQYNGYYGCPFCFTKGTVYPGTKTVKYPYSSNRLDRTKEDILRGMTDGFGKRGGSNGVLGPSPLLNLPFFNVLWGFPVDYLHGVLLGVVKYLMDRVFDDVTLKAGYLGRPKTLKLINTRLLSIKPPNALPRLPHKISDRSHYKGSDYKAWLLYYSLPCVHDLWNIKYLEHFAKLVNAIFLLLKTEVSIANLNTAGTYLDQFVKDSSNLYGLKAMNFNMHSLLHYKACVQMCGPLWSTSTFPFESQMRNYKSKVTGAKGVGIQIAERVIRSAYIPSLKCSGNASDNVQLFLEGIGSSKKPLQKCSVVGNSRLVGNGLFRCFATAESKLLGVSEGTEFQKMIHGCFVYTSKLYCRSKRRCNSLIELKIGGFGEIQSIFVVCYGEVKSCVLIIKALKCEKLKCGNVLVSHIWKCDPIVGSLIAISPDEIAKPCLKMCFQNHKGMLVASLPNTHEVS